MPNFRCSFFYCHLTLLLEFSQSIWAVDWGVKPNFRSVIFHKFFFTFLQKVRRTVKSVEKNDIQSRAGIRSNIDAAPAGAGRKMIVMDLSHWRRHAAFGNTIVTVVH